MRLFFINMVGTDWFVVRVQITNAQITGDSIRITLKELEENTFIHPSTFIDVPLNKIDPRMKEGIIRTQGKVIEGFEVDLKIYGRMPEWKDYNKLK